MVTAGDLSAVGQHNITHHYNIPEGFVVCTAGDLSAIGQEEGALHTVLVAAEDFRLRLGLVQVKYPEKLLVAARQ